MRETEQKRTWYEGAERPYSQRIRAEGEASKRAEYLYDQLCQLREQNKHLSSTVTDLKNKAVKVCKDIVDLKDDAALEKSIVKWLEIAIGVGEDRGGDNCALCQRHKGFLNYTHCESCAVMKESGARGCNDTPFREWVAHHVEKHEKGRKTDGRQIHRRVECYECKQISLREVNYLKSLRVKRDGVGAQPLSKLKPYTVNPFYTTE